MRDYILPIPRPGVRGYAQHELKPGPIKGTGKEWVICCICTTLFRRKIGQQKPRKTCNSKCSRKLQDALKKELYAKRKNDPEFQKQRREYTAKWHEAHPNYMQKRYKEKKDAS